MEPLWSAPVELGKKVIEDEKGGVSNSSLLCGTAHDLWVPHVESNRMQMSRGNFVFFSIFHPYISELRDIWYGVPQPRIIKTELPCAGGGPQTGPGRDTVHEGEGGGRGGEGDGPRGAVRATALLSPTP